MRFYTYVGTRMRAFFPFTIGLGAVTYLRDRDWLATLIGWALLVAFIYVLLSALWLLGACLHRREIGRKALRSRW